MFQILFFCFVKSMLFSQNVFVLFNFFNFLVCFFFKLWTFCENLFSFCFVFFILSFCSLLFIFIIIILAC